MAIRYWSGAGGDNNWSTTANWDTVPVNGDSVSFGTSARYTSNNDISSLSLVQVLITSSTSYTFTGNSVTITNQTSFQLSAGTHSWSLPVVGPADMVISGDGTLTMSGEISGAATRLATAGSIILILTGSNSYTGKTQVYSGTLKFNSIASVSGGNSALGAPTTTANGTILIGNPGEDLAGTLEYTGSGHSSDRVVDLASPTASLTLKQSGSGNLTLSGGVTATGAGTKTFTIGGDGAGSLILSAATADNSVTNQTNVAKSGTHTLIFSASNTYTGTTVITGGTLQLGNGSTTGALATTSAITVTSPGVLQFNRSNTTTQGTDFNSVIAGTGALIQKGAGGTLVLNGSNTYSGKTSVYDGILSINTILDVSGGASAVGAPTTVANGTIALGNGTTTGTLAYTGALQTTDRVIDLAGTTGGGTIDRTGSGTLRFNSAFTATGAGSKTLTLKGTGGAYIASDIVDNSATNKTSLIKTDSGSWTLASTTSTFSGPTAIQQGTVIIFSIADLSTASSLGAPTTVADGTISIGNSNIAGILRYDGTGSTSNRVINMAGTTGGATITQNGTGLLKFTSDCTATGGGTKYFTIQGSTAGTGEMSGAIVDNSGTNKTYLYKSGTGTWTLSGANTYTNTTEVAGGTLSLGNGSTTGSLSTSSAITVTGALVFNRSNTLTSGTDFKDGIGGTGSVTQAGSGTTVFIGAQTYTGTTTVTGGVLSLGNGGTAGSLSTSSAITVTSPGNLTFNRSNTLTSGTDFKDGIGGTGSVTKTGSGTTIFIGAQTYTGATTITGGILSIGNGGIAGSLSTTSTITVTSPGNLTFNRSNAITGGTDFKDGISGTGSVTQAGSGTTTFTGAHTYTGATTISAGTLALKSTYFSASHAISSGAILELNVVGVTRAYRTTTFSGAGTLRKTGSGTARWSSGTGIGTFALGSGSLIEVLSGTFIGGWDANEVWTNNKSDLYVESGTVFDGDEANIIFNRVNGSGTIKTGYPGAGYLKLTIGIDNGTGGVWSGVITNSEGAGSVEKVGTGTQIFSGANTYTGTTVVSGGILQIGNGSTTGSLSTSSTITVTSPGNLTFNRSNTITSGTNFKDGIGGTGSVTQAGSGTTIFIGAQTYSGATTVTGGVLQLGSGGTGGALSTSSAVTVTSPGILQFNRSNAVAQGTDFKNVIDGTGLVKQIGSGTVEMNGVNTFSGGFTISGAGIVTAATNAEAMGTGTVTIGTGAVRFVVGDLQLANNVVINTGTTGAAGRGLIENLSTGNPGITGTITINAAPGAGGHFASTASGHLYVLYVNSSVRVLQAGGSVHWADVGSSFTAMSIIGDAYVDTDNALPATAVVTIGDGGDGNLLLGQNSQSLAGIIKGSGAATIGGGSNIQDSTLTITGACTFGGVIEGTGPYGFNRHIIINASGQVVTLSGTNTYAGTTTVTSGKLIVTGALSTGAVSVASGATLGGTGTIGGTIAPASGGIIAPGLSGVSIGQLNTTDVALQAGSTYLVDLNGTVPTFDKINSSGTITLAGTLSISSLNNPVAGRVYTIAQAATAISGVFVGLPDGATLTVFGRTLRVNYTTTAVTLTDGLVRATGLLMFFR